MTIRQAKAQAKKSQDARLLDRGVEFQLDLLKELASLNLRGMSTAYADGEIRQGAKMLPTELVPLTCAAVGLESTDDAKAIVLSKGHRGHSREEIAEELLQAVETALMLEGITAASRAHFQAARITEVTTL